MPAADPWAVVDSTPDDPWAVKAVVPVRSGGERFRQNLGDSLARSALGQINRNVDANANSRIDADEILGHVTIEPGGPADKVLQFFGAAPAKPVAITPAAAHERKRRETFQAESDADPFYAAPGGLVGKGLAGAATLGGQVTGAALSPENWVAPGKSLLTRAAGNAAVGGATDAMLQGGDIAAHVQDDYNPWQTVGATVLGGGLSLGADAARPLARAAIDAIPQGLKQAAGDFTDAIADRFNRAVSAGRAAVADPWGVVSRRPAGREPSAIDPDQLDEWTPMREASKRPPPDEYSPQSYSHSTMTGSGRPNGVDGVWDSLIRQESGGHQSAVSPKGAFGRAQLMPDTAKYVAGKLGDPSLAERARTDPAVNERLGRAYLQEQFDTFGDEAAALAAYNWGPGRVAKHIAKVGHPSEIGRDAWIASIPVAETRNYVGRILGGEPAPSLRAPETRAPLDDPLEDSAIPSPFDDDEPFTPAPRRASREERDLTDDALDVIRNGQKVHVDQGPTLSQFIARQGGLADPGGDLSSLDADVWHRGKPFQSKLVREGGLSLEEAAQRAHEAGYFPEVAEPRMDGGDNMQGVDGQALVDAIQREMAGRPRFAREADPRAVELAQHADDLEQMLGELGVHPTTHTNAEIKTALHDYFRQPEPAQMYGMKGAGKVRPIINASDLWRAAPQDLERLLAEAKTSDRDKLVQALGEDGAKEFERLDRARNSMDPRRADPAHAEFDAKFGDLTPHQERLVYGVGESDAQVHDIETVLDAHRDVHAGDPDHWLDYMASVAARRASPADLAKVSRGEGSAEAQAAFVRMQRVHDEMVSRGISPAELPSRMTSALVDRAGYRPEQAAEVIGHFVDQMAGRRKPARPTLLGMGEGPKSERVSLSDGPAEQTLLPGVEPVSDTRRAISDELRRRMERRGYGKPAEGGLFDQSAADGAPRLPAKTGDLFGMTERKGGAPDPTPGEHIDAVTADFAKRGVHIASDGEGIGGPLLRGLEGRWGDTVEALSRLKGGDAVAVLHHPYTGPIDVIWGNEKGGLKHILADHPEVVANLPERLASMTPVQKGANRIRLAGPDGRAVIRLGYDENYDKRWLLTAWEDEKGQGGSGRTDSASIGGPADSPDPLAFPATIDETSRTRRLDPNGQADGSPPKIGDRPADGNDVLGMVQRRASAPKLRDRNPITAGVSNAALEDAARTLRRMRGEPEPAPADAFPDLLASWGGGLRAAPRPGAVPSTGPVGSASYIGQGVAELARRVQEAVGAPVRQKRMTLKRALGQFDNNSGVIRTKAAREINVATHEVGHALDSLNHPSVVAAITAHEREVRAMAYPGANPNHLRQEGFAEFFRWYITNPAHAQKKAPRFYADFEAALHSDAPDVAAELKSVQQDYQAYLAAPSAGVVASNIVTQKPRRPLDRYVEAYRQDGTGAAGMAADEMYAAMLDRVGPLGVAVKALRLIAERNGTPIGDLKTSKNPYRLGRMASGAYASGLMDIRQGVRPHGQLDPRGPSLQQAMVKALGTDWSEAARKDFDAYLISRRMVHEWDRFSAGALKREPDSLSRATHETTIKDFEAAHPHWVEAAAMVHDFASELWRKRYDADLIGESTYLRGLLEHPDYVPAQRDMSDASRLPGKARSAKYAGGAQEFKGSDRPFISPIQSLMREAFELNTLIARNEVLKSLEDVAKHAGVGSGTIIERIPATELTPIQVNALEVARAAAERAGLSERDAETMIANLEAHLGDEAQATIFKSMPINERGEPIVYAWRNGERIALRLADGEFGRQMYDSLVGMTPPQKSMFLDALAAVSHVQRVGITTNPAFTIRNFFRDQLSAWMLTDVGFKPFASGLRGMIDEVSGSKTAKRYNALGGLMGGANVASLGQARELSVPALRPWRFTIPDALRAVVKAAEISETGTRLGIFRHAFDKAKKQGLSDYDAGLEAVFEARDFFDTDLHGSKMLAAKRVLPFFNANLQGMRKAISVGTAEGNLHKLLAPLGKNAPQTPGEKAAYAKAYKLWGKMAALGVAGASLTALYLDDPEYREFDDRERATYWFVKDPGGWIKIPKPFELAALSNIFERAVERVYADDPTAWARMRSGLRDILTPPVQTPVLTIPFEIAANKDYGGRPIVPDNLRGKVDPVLQANVYTSELGKRLGRAVNVSPAIMDHVLAGFLGTWGRDLERLSGVTKSGPRAAASREDIPVISAFTAAPERGTASAAKFWDLMASTGGKMAEAEGSFRQYIKTDAPADALRYLKKMDGPTRGYVLSQVFSEQGSGKFNPLERARLANAVLSEMRRDLASGKPIPGVSGRPVELTGEQRRDADRALAKLQMAETSNGLKGAGVEGWKQREFIARRDYLDALDSASPPLKKLLNLRMKAEKVPTPQQSAEVWPELEARLNGLSDAHLAQLMGKERVNSPRTRLDAALKARAAPPMLPRRAVGQ